MKFTTDTNASRYELSPSEHDELAGWLDEVIVLSQPEDVTGEFFIMNFIMDEKYLAVSSLGKVAATMTKVPYVATELTDVIIEKGEIFEANAEKGIYFDTSVPEPGNFYTEYTMELRHNDFVDTRYTSRASLSIHPPAPKDDRYYFSVRRSIAPTIRTKIGEDTIDYKIETDSNVLSAKIASDPVDVPGGLVTPRPLTPEDMKTNSLQVHAKFISEVVGISVPEFLSRV